MTVERRGKAVVNIQLQGANIQQMLASSGKVVEYPDAASQRSASQGRQSPVGSAGVSSKLGCLPVCHRGAVQPTEDSTVSSCSFGDGDGDVVCDAHGDSDERKGQIRLGTLGAA